MTLLPDNYIETITKLKAQIRQARVKAALKANEVLLELYWEIGQTILLMQEQEGWGANVIERVAVDLKSDSPDFKGLSVRNLKYMVSFAKAFPLFGQQIAAQMQNTDNLVFDIVQARTACANRKIKQNEY
jgi:predicted nuclease of restriction endonuclease-like (RecB) superfamily